MRAAAEPELHPPSRRMSLFKKRVRTPLIVVPAALVALVLNACAGGGATTTATPDTTAPATTEAPTTTTNVDFPVTVTAANGEVTIPAEPVAIVSVSPTATEMLFAIGAGDQVVAVDSFSNFPAEAPVTDLSAFTPNVEAIASYSPDLVITSFDANDLMAGLAELEIPTLLLGAAVTLEDVWAQFEALGAATGHVDGAEQAIADVQAGLQEVIAGTDTSSGLTYYYELDPTAFYSVTSQTFVGSLFGQLGLENVADPADEDGAAFGYPQLTAEFIIAADPDLILLADTVCCGQDASTVAARPGWEEMRAVTTGGVVELNDDVASRWGPRIVELVAAVADKINELVAAG